jgi:hypothetical protein
MDFNLHEGKKYMQQSKIRKHVQRGGAYSEEEIKHAQELLGKPFRLFMKEVSVNGADNFVKNNVVDTKFSEYIMVFTYAFKVLCNIKDIPYFIYEKVSELLKTHNQLINDTVNEQIAYNDKHLLKKAVTAMMSSNVSNFQTLVTLIIADDINNVSVINIDSYQFQFDAGELKICIQNLAKIFSPDNVNDSDTFEILTDMICDAPFYNDYTDITLDKLNDSFRTELKDNSGFYNIFFDIMTKSKPPDASLGSELRTELSNFFNNSTKHDMSNYCLIAKKKRPYILFKYDNDHINKMLSTQAGGKLNITFRDLLKEYLNKKNYLYDVNDSIKSIDLEKLLNISNAILEYNDENNTDTEKYIQIVSSPTDKENIITYDDFVKNYYNKITNFDIPNISNINYGGPKNSNLPLDQRILRTDNNITPELANFNFALGQIHLKDKKEWSRDENGILQKYIKKDGKYETQPVLNLGDMCLRDANTSFDEQKCLDFLKSAGLKKTDYTSDLLNNLTNYLTIDSNTASGIINNFNPYTLSKALGNVHPNLAAYILLNFGFKRVTEKNQNTGLVTDTLQDVKSWLRDLSNDKIAESKFGNNANVKTLRDAVGLNGIFGVQAQNILTYFHILREWVTANPGVLNYEFVWKNPTDIKLDEPAPNDKFKLYAYKSPQLKISLYKVNDNLSRLNTIVLKYGGTFNPEKTLNDTIKTPWPLHAPLNPYAYAFPHSPLNPQMFMGQSGGDSSSIQAELEKNGLSGAKLLKEAYNSIVGILKVDPINKTVSDHTDTEMNNRLNKLEEAEASVYQSMNNLVDRYRLYIESKGQIDVLRVQDDDLPALMKKHTELFNKTQSYTKKCTNIITCLKKLADIAEKALEKESQ